MKSIITLILSLSFFTIARPQENLKIHKIRFNGNQSFNSLKLKEQLTLSPTSFIKETIFRKEPVFYSQHLLEDDLIRLRIFYQKEGYLNVKLPEPTIELTDKNKVDITFNVVEGDPISVNAITYRVDGQSQLEESLPNREAKIIRLQSELRENHLFRDEWCFNDQLLITTQFNNIGYAYAETMYSIKVDTVKRSANIEWDITKHKLVKFGATSIEGNQRVPDKSIRRQLTYQEGDTWTKDDIDLSQRHIFNLGMFRVSSLKTLSQEKQLDTLPIQITIKEAPVWTTRFGAGYGREDKFRVFGEIQRLGTITKVGRVNLYAKHSALEPYFFDFKFTQPAILFPINAMIINPYIQKQNEPGYTLKRNGFNLSFLQNFSDYLNTNITFFFEDVKQDTTDLDLLQLNELEETVYLKSGISLGFLLLNGEPRLDPINGHSLSFNLKTNGLIFTHKMPFIRSLIEYKKYWGLDYGLTLAFKGKVGFAYATDGSNYIPPEERFFAGGSHSVRGWARADLGPKNENGKPLGGKSLLEGSTELRLNITPKVILATFMDFGNIWRPSFTYRLNNLSYATGLGIRYKTPIGPAGIDFARPVFNQQTDWQFHFNIGHPF